MSFARNYERNIDKMAENAIFSVYAVPIFVYQKQTYDDKYVDFSRLFHKIHKFSYVLVYILIRKNQTVCSQATIKFVFFFQFFVSKENTALDKNASCF